MGLKLFEKLILIAVIALFWILAIVIWWATLWHAETFVVFGGALPSWSILAIESAKLGIPFAIAGLFTLVLIFVAFRYSQKTLLVSCSLLGIASVFSIMVMIGLTSPLVRLCGEFVPGWPSAFETNTNQAPNTTTANTIKGCSG